MGRATADHRSRSGCGARSARRSTTDAEGGAHRLLIGDRAVLRGHAAAVPDRSRVAGAAANPRIPPRPISPTSAADPEYGSTPRPASVAPGRQHPKPELLSPLRGRANHPVSLCCDPRLALHHQRGGSPTALPCARKLLELPATPSHGTLPPVANAQILVTQARN